jgi:hypothetical protein
VARKNTALWNSKMQEERTIPVAERLADRCRFKGTVQPVGVDLETMRRLNKRVGRHGRQYHEQHVQEIEVDALQADERHGFASSKQQLAWKAELMGPANKFVIPYVQGRRDETLSRCLLADGATRLAHPPDIALFTNGLSAYATLFSQIFGCPYQPARQGTRVYNWCRPHCSLRQRLPQFTGNKLYQQHTPCYGSRADCFHFVHRRCSSYACLSVFQSEIISLDYRNTKSLLK